MQSENTPAAPAGSVAGPPAAYHIDTGVAPEHIEAFPLEFSGAGGEFFRVWIVNLLLNIVTLGFYTPFARRRTAKYFYGHTLVAGSPLEFTAQQRKMVFGFLLLVAIYVAFKVAAQTGQETTTSMLLLAGAALAPYFWGSAMRFRLGATRWRGVRLQFTAGWGEVYKASWPVFAIALAWIAVILTFAGVAAQMPQQPKGGGSLALLWAAVPPLAWLLIGGALVLTFLCVVRLEFNYKSLLVSRARIGGQLGRWKPVYRDFVRIWLATLGVFAASLAAFIALLAAVIGGSVRAFSGAPGPTGPGLILAIIAGIAAFAFGLLFASAPARAYRQARMFQLVWNSVGVSRIARFRCDLRTRRFVLLRLKNMLLTLLTLGFYRPFAMVSEYAMKNASVTLHVKGGLDQLAGQLASQQDGLGDAIADAVGLDLVG